VGTNLDSIPQEIRLFLGYFVIVVYALFIKCRSSAEKTKKNLLMLSNMIEQFPRNEPRNFDLHQHLANIRAKFRQVSISYFHTVHIPNLIQTFVSS
jgi:hypothetical protein